MKMEKGKLKKVKNSFQVTVATKKGTADLQIPAAAVCFRPADAEEGMEVDVERDEKSRITKVTIPGKEVVTPQRNDPKSGKREKGKEFERGGRGGDQRHERAGRSGRGQPTAIRELKKASASVFGSPFHNPYTFLPFSDKPPTRKEVTPHSIDEIESDRFTGVLQLEITTKSPLLTCNPEGQEIKGHKSYDALTIGNDVIVPATGIRGSLRTLLTVLTGGTLGYLNQHAYLCQQRDVNLGPRGPHSPETTPKNVFLAEVVKPGSDFRSGTIRLGKTRLVRLEALEKCYNGKRLPRNLDGPRLWVGLDDDNSERPRPVCVSKKRSPETPWMLKESGRPINLRGKREGVFFPLDETLELPPAYWSAYSGRNAHGDRPELRKGDLIWLEPANANAERIEKAEDIKSIQWARWGRVGHVMKDKLPRNVLPDDLQDDGRVDEITNLFGQVPVERDATAPSFSGRIRPENLVFFDATDRVERKVQLAPLAPPHPGCTAFYRDNQNPDDVSIEDDLKGYKVYRTTEERGEDAPWKYENQGVFGERGELKAGPQKVNKTCDLLKEGVSGNLRITFRSLTKRELALLIQACEVPWRLGGGKPFGLGLCRVRIKSIIDEDGEPLGASGWSTKVNDGYLAIAGWEAEVVDLHARVRTWVASQSPVMRLRYPRAVDENRNKKSRGGYVWFQRHAAPRKVTRKDGTKEPGLEPTYIGGQLKQSAEQADQTLDANEPMAAGQVLPAFDAEHPLDDVLFGYDAIGVETEMRRNRQTVFLTVEEFDPTKHHRSTDHSEGSQGKDAKFRQKLKQGRQAAE